jgi:hypothetical protein
MLAKSVASASARAALVGAASPSTTVPAIRALTRGFFGDGL